MSLGSGAAKNILFHKCEVAQLAARSPECLLFHHALCLTLLRFLLHVKLKFVNLTQYLSQTSPSTSVAYERAHSWHHLIDSIENQTECAGEGFPLGSFGSEMFPSVRCEPIEAGPLAFLRQAPRRATASPWPQGGAAPGISDPVSTCGRSSEVRCIRLAIACP